MSPIGETPPRRERGFTLVEALGAFVILALALGAVHGSFSTGLTGADRAERVIYATETARSLLAEAGATAPLEAGSRVVALDDGWEARLAMSPVRTPSAAGVSAWALSVEVADRRGGPALARLDSVRLDGLSAEVGR